MINKYVSQVIIIIETNVNKFGHAKLSELHVHII